MQRGLACGRYMLTWVLCGWVRSVQSGNHAGGVAFNRRYTLRGPQLLALFAGLHENCLNDVAVFAQVGLLTVVLNRVL